MNESRLAVVKVLRSYPGITQNIDLTPTSALVTELAALIEAAKKQD